MQGAGADKIKEALEIIEQNETECFHIYDYDDEILSIFMNELKDDQFFIKDALRAGENDYSNRYDDSHADEYAERIIANFTTPEESCGSMLYQLVNNKKLMEIMEDFNGYRRRVWTKLMVSLVKNPHTSGDDIKKSFVSLLEQKHHETARLLLEEIDIDPGIFSEAKLNNIPPDICYDLFAIAGDRTGCHSEMQVIGTAKERINYYSAMNDPSKSVVKSKRFIRCSDDKLVSNYFIPQDYLLSSCFGKYIYDNRASCSFNRDQLKVAAGNGSMELIYSEGKLKTVRCDKSSSPANWVPFLAKM